MFGRKKVRLTAEGRVLAAKGKVSQAFKMFNDAYSTITEANKEIAAAIDEHDKNITAHEAKLKSEINLKQKALDEILVNNKIAAKLQEFIK